MIRKLSLALALLAALGAATLCLGPSTPLRVAMARSGYIVASS